MAPVLRFNDDVELGALDRGIVEEALVVDLDDVAGVLADHPRKAGKGPRHIGQLAAQANEPALAHQAAHQDRGEQPRTEKRPPYRATLAAASGRYPS